MRTTIMRRALRSGSYASLASIFLLLVGGIRDCRSAIAPVNAVSHWIWKDAAIHEQDASVRYSLSGACIHHAASVFWAVFYEVSMARSRKPPAAPDIIVRAGMVAAVACFVDMYCTPQRLTPGFERRLSRTSLLFVYGAFGLGLALHTLHRRSRRR